MGFSIYNRETLLYFEMIDIIRSPEMLKVLTGSWSKAMSEKKEKLKQE
jgi:hypothetical protein